MKTDLASIERAEKRGRALELRKLGVTYERIAVMLGYASKAGAYGAVKQAISEITRDAAEDVRLLELARLDHMYEAAAKLLLSNRQLVQQGRVIVGVVDEDLKLKALDRMLRIQERRARLLGLDAPTKTSVTVITEDVIDAELQRLAAEIGYRSAAREARPSAGTSEGVGEPTR